MANPANPEAESQKVPCSVCRKEIPLSAALTPQGSDYVGYFCGIECYEQFAAQKNAGKPETPRQT